MHKIRAEKRLAKKYRKTEKLTNWNTQLEIYSRRRAELSEVVINRQSKFSSGGSDVKVEEVMAYVFSQDEGSDRSF